MNESGTKVCSHNWRTYWARFQGQGKVYIDHLRCTMCGRELDAEYIVCILGYVLTADNLKKIDEAINAENNRDNS